MNLVEVSDWLSNKLILSTTAEPLVYPYDAPCGVLFNLGFTNVQVLEDRPNYNIEIKQRPTIIINFIDRERTPKTYGGANSQKENKHQIQLDILWIADFLGTPVKDVTGNITSYSNPVYTDFRLSNRYFKNFLSSLDLVYDSLMLLKTSSSTIEPTNVKLIGKLTGQNSMIKEVSGFNKLNIASTELAENKTDLFYAARLDLTITEISY